jgi:hypothetical protein
VIVDAILNPINQRDVICNRNLQTGHAAKIGLTFMVPPIVLTVSSVGALRNVSQ